MDPDRTAFERGNAAELVGVGVAPGGCHAHIGRERCATIQSYGSAGFEVRPDQQREWRTLLEAIELDCQIQWRTDRNDEPPDVQGIHPPLHPAERLVVEGHVA